MTEQEALKRLKDILDEATADENSICYVTDYDETPLKLAIESLEKQIPKKPLDFGNEAYLCPCCKRNNFYKGICLYKENYCSECGQAIKWE